MSEIPYRYYDLWNNKADIFIPSFSYELACLVHWWQWQAAFAQARNEATNAHLIHRLQSLCALQHSSIDMGSHIRPNVFRDVYAGRIFGLHIIQHTESHCCRQGPVCSRWRRILHTHWYAPYYKSWHEMQPWLSPFTDDSSALFHGRSTHHCILIAYLNTISNELWPTLVFHFYVTPASQFCSAFFEHALLSTVTGP